MQASGPIRITKGTSAASLRSPRSSRRCLFLRAFFFTRRGRAIPIRRAQYDNRHRHSATDRKGRAGQGRRVGRLFLRFRAAMHPLHAVLPQSIDGRGPRIRSGEWPRIDRPDLCHTHLTHDIPLTLRTSQRRIDRDSSIQNSCWTMDHRARKSQPMIIQRYRLYVERKNASRNMARFYAMSIEPNLFGDISLIRRWGRIGTHGQQMEHSFSREEEAVALFLDLLKRKRQRGYRPRGIHKPHA